METAGFTAHIEKAIRLVDLVDTISTSTQCVADGIRQIALDPNEGTVGGAQYRQPGFSVSNQ
jgi:hypothetical protein